MRDLLRIQSREHKVKVVGGALSAFRSKDIVKTGARLFTKDGLVASAASVGDVSDGALYEACLGNRDAALSVEVVPTGTHRQGWRTKGKHAVSPENALELAADYAGFLTRELPNFVVQGQVVLSSQEIAYRNELGADLSVGTESQEFVFDLRRRGSPNIADCFLYHSDLVGSTAAEDLSWSAELFRAFDRSVELKPGRHRVLMLPEDSALNKLGESLQAEAYSEGTALYSKRLGDTIFSPKFTLSDLRLRAARGAFKPFDYEGGVAAGESTVLVERGRLKTLVSDLKNQKRHGVASTANGFRSYNSSVRLGFSQLGVEPGARAFREILRDAGEVIVCSLTAGGDLTAQGDFSTPVQLAFLCRDGQVVGKLPQLSLSSTLERMFGADLLEVAADGPYKHSSQPYLLTEMGVQLI